MEFLDVNDDLNEATGFVDLNKCFIIFNFYRIKITSNIIPDDDIAIKMGRMFFEVKNQSQEKLSENIEAIKQLEKQKELDGTNFFYKILVKFKYYRPILEINELKEQTKIKQEAAEKAKQAAEKNQTKIDRKRRSV